MPLTDDCGTYLYSLIYYRFRTNMLSSEFNNGDMSRMGKRPIIQFLLYFQDLQR